MSARKLGTRKHINKLREMEDAYSKEVTLAKYSTEVAAFSSTQMIDATVRLFRKDPFPIGEVFCVIKVTLNSSGDIVASVKNHGGLPLSINIISSGSNRVVVKAQMDYTGIGSLPFDCVVECRYIDYIVFNTYLYKWRGEQEPPLKTLFITGREFTTVNRCSIDEKPFTEDIGKVLESGTDLLTRKDLNNSQSALVFNSIGNTETEVQLVNAAGENIKMGMAWLIRVHNMKYLKKGLLLYIATHSATGLTVEEIFRSGDISNLTLEVRSDRTLWLVGKDGNTDPVGINIQESAWVDNYYTTINACQTDAFAFERQLASLLQNTEAGGGSTPYLKKIGGRWASFPISEQFFANIRREGTSDDNREFVWELSPTIATMDFLEMNIELAVRDSISLRVSLFGTSTRGSRAEAQIGYYNTTVAGMPQGSSVTSQMVSATFPISWESENPLKDIRLRFYVGTSGGEVRNLDDVGLRMMSASSYNIYKIDHK